MAGRPIKLISDTLATIECWIAVLISLEAYVMFNVREFGRERDKEALEDIQKLLGAWRSYRSTLQQGRLFEGEDG